MPALRSTGVRHVSAGWILGLACGTGAWGSVLADAPAGDAARPVDFAAQVKPILQRSCLGCHGPEKRRGGLRLDRKDLALAGGDSGEPAIVPGNAPSGGLLDRIASDKEGYRMPPRGERLSADEIE